MTKVTILLDDYFKTNPRVKDLSRPGIEPQSPSPQPVVIAVTPPYRSDPGQPIKKFYRLKINTLWEGKIKSQITLHLFMFC